MRSLLNYKDALLNLIDKEIKVRYLGAALGFLWSFGNPILFTLVYYFVFTHVFPSAQANYALYIVVGVLHWTLFSQTIAESSEILTKNANLIKKLNFPRIIIPCSVFLTHFLFWFAGLVVFFVAFYLLGGHFSWQLLEYPLVLLLYLLFIWGVGLTLSVLYIRLRDLKHLIDVLLQLLFWLTPIVYDSGRLSDRVQGLLSLNPVGHFIQAFHLIFYKNQWLNTSALLLLAAFSSLALLVGCLLYRSTVDKQVEYL